MIEDRPVKKPAVRRPRSGRGRPRDEGKHAAIITAASALFLENGFDGSSMDEVARRAGVSKQTVYSHFSSKEQLFSASVRAKIESHYPDIILGRLETHSLEGDLRAVCENYCRLLLSKEAISMHRLLVASVDKNGENSDLARIFWESGPRDMEIKLEEFVQIWVDKGELAIADVAHACERLVALLKGRPHFMLSVGLLQVADNDLIEKTVNDAVEVFLRLYKV